MAHLASQRTTASRRVWRWLLVGAAGGVVLMASAVMYVRWRIYRPIPFDRAVGVKLPAEATEFRVEYCPGFDGYEYYATAKMSRAQFDALMQSAGAIPNHPDLAEHASPLEVVSPQVPPWWCNALDATIQVYYAPRAEGFRAAKYQDGHMYLRRAVY